MNSDKSSFWDGLGFAVIILAVFLGFGGCVYLVDKGEALRHNKNHTVVSTNQ